MPLPVDSVLKKLPCGFKAKNDDFFAGANEDFITKYKKLGVISNFEGEETERKEEIFCNVPNCFQIFNSVSSYQTHYNSIHRFICSVCKKTLPTNFLLDMHITENHDSFFMARVERGDVIYSCYLESCSQKFKNPQERKQHCIEEHRFPANFRFDQIHGDGKKANSKQHKRQVKKEDDVDMQHRDNNAVRAHSSNKVKAFHFGHSKEYTFHSTNKKPSKDTNEPASSSSSSSLVDMSNLASALLEEQQQDADMQT